MICVTFGKYPILIACLLIMYKSESGSISENVPFTPKRNVHFYLEKKKSWQKAGNYQMEEAVPHGLYVFPSLLIDALS